MREPCRGAQVRAVQGLLLSGAGPAQQFSQTRELSPGMLKMGDKIETARLHLVSLEAN